MKKLLLSTLFCGLFFLNNTFCSHVVFHNHTPFSVETENDFPAYPDPKNHINKNATRDDDNGLLFLRGTKVSAYIEDQIVENILSENLKQTLGFGDINYHIFTDIQNLGLYKFTQDEYVLKVTFYLHREPKGLYFGGIVSTSNPIKVRTKDFEHFTLIKEEDNCSQPTICCCN